jgi:CDP-4-dehydro-6-deoxyglucose reductase
MASAGIPDAFRRRRRQVQHVARQTGEAQKALRVVKVAAYRADVKSTPGFFFLRTAQKGEHPKAPREPGGGATGNIPAADDQQSLHTNILAPAQNSAYKPEKTSKAFAMTYQITVQPGGLTCAANPEETLLEAILRQGLTMPYGCKNGACGACRGHVKSGEIDLGAYQSFALPEGDIAAGKALFCCARAKSDLIVEHPGIALADDVRPKIFPARVEGLTRRAPDVIELSLRLPAGEDFSFRAGQYVDFLIMDGKRRSYSIANAPEQTGILELHIRHVPGGYFTGHVFGDMKVKDILRLEGPLGGFFLREESDKPVILLASGTGFAPIKAIVEHALAQGNVRPLHIYWGCRQEIDLYLDELPARWAADHAHIRYTPVLSEAKAGWRGRTGFVHQAVMADYPDLSGHQVYACGAPAMIHAAQEDFRAARGLPESEFFADAFTFAAPGA